MFPFSPRSVRPLSGFLVPILLLFGNLLIARAAETPPPLVIGGASGTGATRSGVELAVIPFLPAGTTANNAGVLIVPDAADPKGTLDGMSVALAQRLAERGLASFVLRTTAAGSPPNIFRSADVARALRAIVGRAAEFKLNPTRVGVVGLGQGAPATAEFAYASKPGSSPLANAVPTKEAEANPARPAFVALIWGSPEVASVPADGPPAFLVGSTRAGDNLSGSIELWTKLREARVPVDAHFFAQRDDSPEAVFTDSSAVGWPEMFYTWTRFQGFLTDAPRLALKGMAYLDGHPLPQGYVIFTPVDFVGAGPIVARVINSTAGVPIGEFSVPASQGPVAGRYKVEVRQNMNWWLSNAFSGPLVNARNGVTPEQAYFGHHRVLAPSIADQQVFTKQRPTDPQGYLIEFKPGAANEDLKIEVFTK